MKFLKTQIVAVIGLILLVSSSSLVLGQVKLQSASTRSNGTALFALEDLKPGMKGVARTVFSGSEPQEFGLEILGVLNGYTGPRQSTIIAKLNGPNVDRTGVFAGMSGSPVFIDNKLVGAIAYSFPFSKEPICGITPIKQMIDIFEQGKEKPKATEARAVSFSSLARADWKPSLPKQSVTATSLIAPVSSNSALAPLMGQQIQPIATPVVFSGIKQETLSLFTTQLTESGLLPVSGVGGAAPITPLESFDANTLVPGASVTVQLARGDYSIAAAGTVTYRDGERIYAFGHPFLSLGSADMPMTESSVVIVIPNTFNSFKLAVPGRMVGAISQDRATGVFGELGRAPKMIPVKLNLHTSRGQDEEFSYEIVSDEFLTPLLLNLTVFNSIAARERSVGEATISVDGSIAVTGQAPITIQRRFSSGNAALLAAGAVATPAAALLGSGFDNVSIGAIKLNIVSSEEKNAATLERISLDRTEVGRGENVEIQAYVRTDSGKQFVERIPVQIPADAPSGQLMIMVGDGATLQESSSAKVFVPRELGQLVDAINKTKKNDRLYLKLLRPAPGVVIGSNELPNLPPSMVATLNNERTSGGYTPLILSPVYERELPPAEFVISGQQVIAVTVK
ncbi:MAG TPA: SpoIVB peptidase S55 domain-containing protein [Pyrinomonadaceae bacterium]|nr:SpoIVB peptidase S55 domain-containing protein [Pyrinomonadaceae bacterium]